MHRLLGCLICLVFVCAGAAPLWSGEETDHTPRPGAFTHLLNLALLVASNDAPDGGDPLPAPVAKAVGDIKEFLPYKNYRMYDSVVVRTANLEATRIEIQGPEALRYTGVLVYQVLPERTKLNFTRFEIARTHVLIAPRPRSAGDDPDVTPQPPASPEVISTGFSVSVGETIVVGTSRMKDSGKALVIVLTVLPAK